MKMYYDDNLKEWSRRLITKFGNYFRLYSDDKETLERWSERLSFIFKTRFQIEETEEATLRNWSKLIGG